MKKVIIFHPRFRVNSNVSSRNGLITDEYLRVKNTNGTIYAIGDCSVVEQEKLVESVGEWFQKADKNADGTLTMEEFTGKKPIHFPTAIPMYEHCTSLFQTSVDYGLAITIALMSSFLDQELVPKRC